MTKKIERLRERLKNVEAPLRMSRHPRFECK